MKNSLIEITLQDYIPVLNYSFLDILEGNSFLYYSIIEQMDEYKLINLYRFIFLRIHKINRKFPCIPPMKLHKHRITHDELNALFTNYIQTSQLRAILILQGIYHYKFPKVMKKQLDS